MRPSVALAAVCLALLSTVPAHAERGDGRGGRDRREAVQEDRRDSRDREEARGDGRDRRDEQQSRSRGRLSPEERRQLRRDIDDAGREIYRERRDR